MDFSYNIKLRVNFCTSLKNWVSFYACYKTKPIFMRYKNESIFAKELQKLNLFNVLAIKTESIFAKHKNQVNFCKLASSKNG